MYTPGAANSCEYRHVAAWSIASLTLCILVVLSVDCRIVLLMARLSQLHSLKKPAQKDGFLGSLRQCQ
jgi:hypothetical protein